MHYANGREAKNGDMIVWRLGNGALLTGFLYDAQPGNDWCNGRIAQIKPDDPQPNLKECLHLDDIDIGCLKPAPRPEKGGR